VLSENEIHTKRGLIYSNKDKRHKLICGFDAMGSVAELVEVLPMMHRRPCWIVDGRVAWPPMLITPR